LFCKQISAIKAFVALEVQQSRPDRSTEKEPAMLKLAIASVASATISAVATFQSITAQTVADDRCYTLGYQSCTVVNGVSAPDTFDPKIRAAMTKHVRQMVRDRSRG
jgi:hypothetical protein